MPASKIWLSSPHMSGREQPYINEAFQENWVAPLGPNVDGFEKDLENYVGENTFAAALSSGTAAIHLGLIILGVKAGDEVLCQTFTFCATANPIVYQGATPVFVGSEADTWNMDPAQLEDAIKDRISKGKSPKAIIVVHLYGMPAKMKEIMEVANKYGIPVLEDAAEALGSHIDGKMCGTFGEMAVLSFNGNKIITTSGGGALLSSNQEYIKKARFLATQARDEKPYYQHSQIGYNYRMSNICAGIGRGQMEVLKERVQQRRGNYYQYVDGLQDLNGLSFLHEPKGFYSNRWLTTITIDPKESGGITSEDLRLALLEENIDSRPLWKPMHLQPVFKNAPSYVSGKSEILFDKGLCLPSGSNLLHEHKDKVIEVIKKAWKELPLKDAKSFGSKLMVHALSFALLIDVL